MAVIDHRDLDDLGRAPDVGQRLKSYTIHFLCLVNGLQANARSSLFGLQHCTTLYAKSCITHYTRSHELDVSFFFPIFSFSLTAVWPRDEIQYPGSCRSCPQTGYVPIVFFTAIHGI